MEKFTVLDLLELDLTETMNLQLRCLYGRKGLVREIKLPQINRPGLALSGFFELFVSQRIQVYGRGEVAYLNKLEELDTMDNVARILQEQPPCCVFCHNQEPGENFKNLAEEYGTPILQTPLESSDFSVRLIQSLSEIFAPEKTLHGVFIEVHGMGVLIRGESGVGKSEIALELVARGHRLVADDAVLIKRLNGNMLLGFGTNKLMGSHMEIRGMGIVNIAQVYGVSSVKERKQLEIIVELEEWENNKTYDRLGSNTVTQEILGIKVPTITLPIKPGRNIPIIIETAVLNERLKQRGISAASNFDKDVIQWLESENARKLYFENFS
ncbi:MAG: HPr(Ser) kinase/phosphatase [Spirochaetaceae bacterium]|jgi:HPr kinase/phosphorylase|nr:HPr(Ser) kinase/phosphatase [Spirochaetaceae bacterium]